MTVADKTNNDPTAVWMDGTVCRIIVLCLDPPRRCRFPHTDHFFVCVYEGVSDDNHILRREHAFEVFFVFCSYIPEILFFFFVIERYASVGDYEIMRRVTGLTAGMEQ